MQETGRYIVWVISLTIWTAICFIAPDYLDNPIDGWFSLARVLGHITACSIGAFLILYVIGCNKYISAILLPIWGLVGSALAFYRVGYHVTLTPMLIDVLIHTNTEEALGVISWQVILWVASNLCVAGIAVWVRWRYIDFPYRWVHCVVAIIVGCLFIGGLSKLRRVVLNQRFPLNIVYYTHEYISNLHPAVSNRRVPDYRITDKPDSLTVVLIIGEAVRADHLQLNGYARETTPRLMERTNIVSLPHLYTEQTHTLSSMPYLLTRADSAHEAYQYEEHSFIQMFNEAGFRTAWISNQDMGTTYRDFITESDTVIFANAGKSVFVYSEWLDEELIPAMSPFIQHSPTNLLILHTIGSHWYYNNHAPQAMQVFQPVTTNRVVTNNSTEQLINSYDNTVLYMDYFADSVIATIADQKAIVIYQSDHGESLGENGKYLHGYDEEPQHHPAGFVWYSDSYAASYPDKIKALTLNKDKRYRTDYLFYSILYSAGIEAAGDTPEMNIFR